MSKKKRVFLPQNNRKWTKSQKTFRPTHLELLAELVRSNRRLRRNSVLRNNRILTGDRRFGNAYGIVVGFAHAESLLLYDFACFRTRQQVAVQYFKNIKTKPAGLVRSNRRLRRSSVSFSQMKIRLNPF